jgi:uncharacterized protein (TIGR03067 family)
MPTDFDALQGAWNVSTLELEGNRMHEGVLRGSGIVIHGDQFETTAMGATYRGTFRVNAEVTPRTIDLHFHEGPEKGNTALGIYELAGDSWQLCLAVTARARPTAFATSPGSGLALERLKRRTEAQVDSEVTKQADAGFAPGDPAPELEGEWAMVSGIRDGLLMDNMMVRSGRRVATGGETTVSFGGQVFIKAKYAVDKSRLPNEIDYYHSGGVYGNSRQQGIFKLSEGLLTVIFASPGQPRPTDFSTRTGDGRTLTVWKKK